MDLRIAEIAKACGGELSLKNASADTQVDSVVLDSRKVSKGGVFIATVGERVDGHRFIGQVFEAGAALVITQKSPKQVEEESGVPAAEWGSYLLVEDSFAALKSMAEYYRSKLTLPIVGITGSVGKTSTKEFIAGVLAEKYQVLKTEGNFNNEVGVPLTLLRIRQEHQAAVVEMGISEFGEMHRLSKMVRPNICVITNIGQCHLENLGSREGILKAKTEIFDYMPADAEVCLNGEDDMLRTLEEVHCGRCLEDDGETGTGKGKGKGQRPHFFGLGNFACEEVYADGIVGKGLWGSDAIMHMSGDFSVNISMPGAHMVINGAAAACVAGLLGLTKEQIAAGLAKIQPVDGRNHILRLNGYTLIDDCYNANPVSMKAAVDLLALADTYRVAILGDMFELGEKSDEMHAEVGAYAADSGAECILLVGEHAKHLYEGALGAKNAAVSRDAAAAGVQDATPAGKQRVLYFQEKKDLMEALASGRGELLPKGCTVLVKASHGMGFAQVVEYLKEEDEKASG